MSKLLIIGLTVLLTGCATCPPSPPAKEQLILQVPEEYMKVPEPLKQLDPAAGQK